VRRRPIRRRLRRSGGGKDAEDKISGTTSFRVQQRTASLTTTTVRRKEIAIGKTEEEMYVVQAHAGHGSV
jgi:hypothetical protein